MATASEIRRRVREQEKRRIQDRTAAVLSVAEAGERLAAAEDAVLAAMAVLEDAVNTAIGTHGYGVEELAEVTDLPVKRLRWPRSVEPIRSAIKASRSNSGEDAEDQDEQVSTPVSHQAVDGAPAQP